MPMRSLGLSNLRAQYNDEALVVLETVDAPPNVLLPHRHILLTKESPTVRIGRTSKRNSNYEATKSNAYIDSAVISREHALLEFDLENKKVILRDVGSLHGTFHNDKALARNDTRQLKDGDIVRFGIPIERGSEVHPACTMEAFVQFGTQPRPRNQPTVFRVPEDTDIEDISSGEDDDEVQIKHTARVLVNNDFRPAPLGLAASSATAIDLTVNDIAPDSHYRAGGSSNQAVFDDYASNVVDLTSQVDAESQRDQDDIEDYDVTVEGSAWEALEGGGFGQARGEASAEISLSDALGVEDSVWSSPSSRPSSAHSELSICSAPSIASDESADDSADRDRLSFSLGGDEHDDMDERDDFDVEQEDDDVPGESIITDDGNSSHDDAYGNGAINVNEPAIIMSGAVPASTYGTVDTNSYLLHRNQPPIDPPEKLPSISTGLFSPPYNGRLPSIQAIHSSAHEIQAPAHPNHMSGAEWLGAKTGKMEFFTAREENRMNLNMKPFLEPSASGGVSAIPPVQVQRSLATHMPVDTSPSRETKTTREPEHMEAAPGIWSASGTTFLNSPPDELPEQPAWHADAFLDETSAYQFEVSKKAASAKAALDAQMERLQSLQEDLQTPREVLDDVQTKDSTSWPLSQTDGASKLKRKAADISISTPEEEAAVASVAVKATTPEAAPSTLPVAVTSKPVAPRPVKRLRRVAEAFGIAALGGAAVMSALIATAPSF